MNNKKIPLFSRNSFFIQLFIFVLVFGSVTTSCNKKKANDFAIGKVKKGTLYLDLYETGEIRTVNSVSIDAPRLSWRYGGMLKIIQLIKDGEEVKKGDTIVVFDPSSLQNTIIELVQRKQLAQMELEKMQSEHQLALEEAMANYKIADISYQISKIRFESIDYEADIKKREIKLNLERAKLSLDKAREDIENLKKIQKEELTQENIFINQANADLVEANEALKQLYVVSSSSGIAIVQKNWSTGNAWQISDQCWGGSTIAELPDMSKLKAIINVNEVDVSKLKKGQKVEIKPDAFSEKIFTGKIVDIANLAIPKEDDSKIKVFPVEILLDQTDKNLLPGLSVSCRIIFDKLENILYIPLDAILKEGDKSYVFKKRGSGYNKLEIEVGENSTDFIIVTKGLEENDEIALSNPFEKENDINNAKEDENEK